MIPPFDSNQNREEASKNGRKGGVESGKARRRNRDARSAIRYLLKLAPIGNAADNLKAMGYPENEQTNMAALQARLYHKAMTGDIEAYRTMMRMAGFEPEENRKERESISSERRRDLEVDAKLKALSAAPDNSSMTVSTVDEDGNNDVHIFIPKMMNEQDCQVDEDGTDYDSGSEDAQSGNE